MDLSKLSVSNGSGEAVRGLVTVLRSPGGTVITPNSLVNWPTNFVATTGPLLADGTLDPAKTLVFLGHVSGSTYIIDTLAPGYVDTYGSAVGDVVVIKPNTWWADTLVNTVAVSHNADGTIKNSAVTTVLNAIGGTGTGWFPLGLAPTSVVAKGNRSYEVTFASSIAALVSPGYRFRPTRTVASPNQCATLDGVNDYFSKSSPTGMTFTDDFADGGWVKMTAYPASSGVLSSRYNATSGFALDVLASGKVRMYGYNAGAGNYSGIDSYQSLPLNKWVHIAAQLDMSAFTATTTTSYIMFDGENVPAAVARAGTNPTALIQAGSYELGSSNGGTNLFTGKMSQFWFAPIKVTQANVKTIYSQGLTAALISSLGLGSAHSLSNSVTDLNTTNANNLTANGGVLTTTADAPWGQQADGTVSTTLDYGILQQLDATGMIANIQVPEGCTFPTSGGITSMSYSPIGYPLGYPGNRDKFDVESYYLTRLTAAGGAANTFINLGHQISAPIGKWSGGYSSYAVSAHAGVSYLGHAITLSTANNTQSNKFATSFSPITNSSNNEVDGYHFRAGIPISVSAATVHYLNIAPTTTAQNVFIGDASAVNLGTLIKLENTYA